MNISVAELFEDYAKRTLAHIPRESIQFIETKRTFYAAVSLTLAKTRDVLGRDDVSEEDGVATLQKMMDEVLAFYEEQVRAYKK